ncbi:MAG: AraC family transcriptional regulator [Chitinophagaceae bacterium]|nr:AraC family transcriptional regulator [Chitinophagaceae bacterium]
MIKASFESLHPINGNSFLLRRFDEKAFSAPYHYHPELELTLILKGEGKRYVGSNMSAYSAGDLVLVGSNLPHCWKSENVKKGKINASSLVIQFTTDFLGSDFFLTQEMSMIRKIFETSKSGIHFQGDIALRIKEDLLTLDEEASPFAKLIMFLTILQNLSLSKEFSLLDKQQHSFTYSPSEQKRIHDVMAYIVENFRKEIILEEAATKAKMTSTAFCKYFKRITRKTFMETVIDYRVNYAAQQLVHTDKPVSDICFESGFGDVSHFYKTFRNKKKQSPLYYRKKFTNDIA